MAEKQRFLKTLRNALRPPSVDQGSMSDRLKRVELALNPWLKKEIAKRRNVCQNIPGGKLAIPLQHKYTGSLSFARLKGDDISLKELLKECRDKNKKQSLDLHLCTVTKREVQYVSDASCSSEEMEVDFEFEDWIQLDDEPVALEDLLIDMGEELVVPEEGLFESQPNHVIEEDDYMKAKYRPHEPRRLELVYRKDLLVVWPKAHSVAIAWAGSVSRALDILQNTLTTSDPNFREQLHHIVLYCQLNASKVWEDDRNSNTDSVTPLLLSLCTRVSMSEDVLQILRLLGKALYQHDDNKNKGYKVGVRNAEVAEAIVCAVQVFGWQLVWSPIINLAKESSSSQGEFFVHMVRQLICICSMDAGVFVANAASKALEAHLAELESHEMPEFSWCQPRAKFREYPAVERFLKGPQERYEHRGFYNLNASRSFCDQLFKNSGGNASVSYSATAEGRGREAYCLIRKTRHHFDVSMNHWHKEQKSIERLKLELGELRSAVPESNSVALSWQPDRKRRRLRHGNFCGTYEE